MDNQIVKRAKIVGQTIRDIQRVEQVLASVGEPTTDLEHVRHQLIEEMREIPPYAVFVFMRNSHLPIEELVEIERAIPSFVERVLWNPSRKIDASAWLASVYRETTNEQEPETFTSLSHVYGAVRRLLRRRRKWLMNPNAYINHNPRIQWYRDIHRIEELVIQGNNVSGIPDWVYTYLKNLTRLFIGYTMTINNISPLTATNLRTLELHHVRNIEFPSEPIPNLQSLVIDTVQVFPIQWIVTMASTLVELTVSYMNILPEDMKSLVHLRILDVSNNSLVSLPEWLLDFTQLHTLYLNHNQRLRTLPAWMGNMPALTHLEVEECSLTEIPRWVGKLIYLNISNNELNPTDYFNFTNVIENLNIGRTLGFPTWLINVKRTLKTLRVYFNEIREIPPWIGEFKQLEFLDITGNAIRFLPRELLEMPNLKRIDVTEEFANVSHPVYAQLKLHGIITFFADET